MDNITTTIKPRDFRFYASETCEEGERTTAAKIIQEIHDAMCMCGVEPERCDTAGVKETCLEAAQSLIATGEWSIDFEDGWLKVVTI